MSVREPRESYNLCLAHLREHFPESWIYQLYDLYPQRAEHPRIAEAENHLALTCGVDCLDIEAWRAQMMEGLVDRRAEMQVKPQETSASSTVHNVDKSAYHRDSFMMDLTHINEAQELPSLFKLRGHSNQLEMFMPRGKVCVLASEGGVGKSLLSLHLGISLVLGREKTSLRRAAGAYREHSESILGFPLVPVPKFGKVVMLFAEEDQATCAYRLKQLLQVNGRVDPRLLQRLSGHLIPVPLCSLSKDVDNDLSLSDSLRSGDYGEAESRFKQLEQSLESVAGETGIDLIVVDPLAQFGGGDFEKDNGEASRLMRQFQRLTSIKGNPTVLLIHHSSKEASKGKAKLGHAVRGASALKDNARWVGILRRIAESDTGEEYLKDSHGRTVVELVVAKSNYGPCFQRVRYLMHRSEIIEIENPELLSAEVIDRSNDTGGAKPMHDPSASTVPVRGARLR
jgi:hypothetical protein